MKCNEARDMFSDYVEKTLSGADYILMAEHLSLCATCRMELADFNKTLNVMHALQREEPVLDIWREFAPRFAAVHAEMQLSYAQRACRYILNMHETVCEGWRIFTIVVNASTQQKWQRYFLKNAA